MLRIETGLEFVRGPAQEWNNQLVSLIRPQLEKRHAQTRQSHSIDLGYAKAPAYVAPPVLPKLPPKPGSQTAEGSAPPQRAGKNPTAFVSHSTQDHQFVEMFATDLRVRGVEAWFSKW